MIYIRRGNRFFYNANELPKRERESFYFVYLCYIRQFCWIIADTAAAVAFMFGCNRKEYVADRLEFSPNEISICVV